MNGKRYVIPFLLQYGILNVLTAAGGSRTGKMEAAEVLLDKLEGGSFRYVEKNQGKTGERPVRHGNGGGNCVLPHWIIRGHSHIRTIRGILDGHGGDNHGHQRNQCVFR